MKIRAHSWLILFCIFFSSFAHADFRFIHESDPHVNSPTGNDSHIPVDTTCWKEMARLNPQPAFIVDTGDLADHGLASEYATWRKCIADDLPSIRVYGAMGNHDQRWNPLGKEGYIRGTHQPLWQSWDYQGIHFVTLDSTVLLEHWGHIDQAELDWLQKDLAKISNTTPLIIGFHHWIGRDPMMVDNQQALLDIVKPYNMRLWLLGHGHQNLLWNIDGVTAIMTGALYDGSYTLIDVDTTHGIMHLTRRHWGKPNPNKELLNEKVHSYHRSVVWSHIIDIPLAPQPEPKWSADVTRTNDQPQIKVDSGNLPAQSTFAWRIDQNPYQPLDISNPSTSTESRAVPGPSHTENLPLCAGHHQVTVQATLPDGRVYEKSTDLIVVLPGTPKPLWQTNLGSAVLSHLVRNRDALYVSTMSGDLFHLNPQTGNITWKFHTHGSLFSTPFVSGNTLYVGSVDHNLYAIDTSTGKELWHHQTQASILAGPAVAHGIVEIVSTDKTVYGLDATTGAEKWTSHVDGMYQSNAATDGTHFFIAGWDNHVRCLDALTGQTLWTDICGRNKKTGDVEFPYSPAIGAPCVGDGKVFVTSDDGILHALQIVDGKPLWQIDQKNLGYSGPLYHADLVYDAISTDGNIFAANADTGEILWQNHTGSDIYDSTFAYSNGSVFIASVDGIFNRVDATTGKIDWQYSLGPGHVLCSPAVDDAQVYISSMSGTVFAFPIAAR
ncbi:MAG TPA: PQQ-binding-like beta-propeller repeat protein [Tepidisphaeraceae bacterium]